MMQNDFETSNGACFSVIAMRATRHGVSTTFALDFPGELELRNAARM